MNQQQLTILIKTYKGCNHIHFNASVNWVWPGRDVNINIYSKKMLALHVHHKINVWKPLWTSSMHINPWKLTPFYLWVLGKQNIPNSCVITELHPNCRQTYTRLYSSQQLYSLVSKANTFLSVFTKTLITTYSGSVSIAYCTIQRTLPDKISLKPYP